MDICLNIIIKFKHLFNYDKLFVSVLRKNLKSSSSKFSKIMSRKSKPYKLP